MGYPELIDAVQDHAGLASRSDAEATTAAVFGALAERVLPGDRRAVKALVPEELRSAFDVERKSDETGVDAIVQEVAVVEGIAPGFGREHLVVVGAAAASALHPDAITALRTHLPDELAALFRETTPRRVTRPTPHSSPLAGRRISEAHDGSRHVAEARLGSARPISEAKDDPAQTDSVARSDDPHADTKLSGAKGMTQTREHESLSEGKD
jgi:uncharacterized protein (DUF2267 family)